MSFQRVLALAAAVAIAAAGCNDDESTPPEPTSSGPGGAGASGGGGGGMGGNVIPDTECVDATADPVEVYPAGALPLERMASVGERWLASGADGYVLFDRDGGNADPTPTALAANFNTITGEGTRGGIAASSAAAIQYVRINDAGMAVDGPVGVALESPVALSVASAAGNSMVTWGVSGKLEARVIDSVGTPGMTLDIKFGAYSTFIFLSSAARDEQVGIAWSGDAALGMTESFFQLADATGAVGDTVSLIDDGTSHSLTRIAATSAGFVVLVTGPPPENRPFVMTLDAAGAPTSQMVELAGASYAHDLAARGNTFAVTAVRATGEPEMRTFNVDLTPAAAWVCLGADVEPTRPTAIAVDGEGYATLHTSAVGAVILHLVDELGTGSP